MAEYTARYTVWGVVGQGKDIGYDAPFEQTRNFSAKNDLKAFQLAQDEIKILKKRFGNIEVKIASLVEIRQVELNHYAQQHPVS